MHSGDFIEGIAKDTALNADRQECIKLTEADSDQLVVLDEIKSMEALLDNPHFKLVAIT